MKAIVVFRYGPPDVLQLCDMPIFELRLDEVLVGNHFIGVHFVGT